MRKDVFGDSFDIVKKSLLAWLRAFGDWSIHPMFTEEFSDAEVSAYEALLGAKVLSTEILEERTDRQAYLACASSCGNLFLDPDTGLLMQRPTSKQDPVRYLFAKELLWLTERRPESLTMVFDQSLARGSERSDLDRKLKPLHQQGLLGFAYVSHASFVVVSRDRSLIEHSRKHILDESKLPESRFLQVV